MNIVETLKGINWAGLGVNLVIIHGSALWRGRPGDVDLVVFVGSDVGVDDVVLRIMEVVEERVGLEADVYLISDPSRANCFLVWEALRHGRIIYQDGIGRELLVRAINVCYDFMLSRIKLNYTETLVVGWSGMLHNRLLEVIAVHTELLDKMRSRGIHWDDVIDLYAVLHALQVHAQAIIDYLLHTCALVGISAETPIHYIDELSRSNMISRGDVDLLKRIVRFRNIVVHEYGAIDMERVRGIVESRGYNTGLNIIRSLHDKLRSMGIIDP